MIELVVLFLVICVLAYFAYTLLPHPLGLIVAVVLVLILILVVARSADSLKV